MTTPDLLVIGGGAAGLSAASTATGLGLSVELLDERSALGGNFYAGIRRAGPGDAAAGTDYARGPALLSGADAARHFTNTFAWRVETDGVAHVLDAGGSVQSVAPKRLLIATGAMERPVPLPGGTLPGVMYAGAAQLLLKSAGSVPAGRYVLVGSGPLLLLLATQLSAKGVPPLAVIDTSPVPRLGDLVSTLPAALNVPGLLARGMELTAALWKQGIPRYQGARDISILGNDRARGVEFTDRGGSRRSIEVELVLLHDGVIPNDQVTRQLGCAERWNAAQHCFHPTVDEWGETSRPGIFAAGDCTGIWGARAAELAGQLSALQIAAQLGRIRIAERDRRALRLRNELGRHRTFRRFVETLFPPSISVASNAAAQTVVCRCENVTAGEIRTAIAQGATEPDQLKSFTRCGMGPCQGRSCSMAVAEIIASETGTTIEAVGRQEIRAPLKPIPLGKLAAANLEVAR